MNIILVLLLLVVRARGDVLSALEALLPDSVQDNVEDLIEAASAACELFPLELLAPREEEELQLVEFRRSGARVLSASAAARRLRAQRAVPVYVPGWHDSPWDAAARALVAALLRHHRAVLVADTRRAFRRPYPAAAARVPGVARRLAALLGRLPARLHLLGFSLGAHAAGGAGRLLAARGAPPARLTALDAARPCFGGARGVRRTDAQFVLGVHSSALGLAAPLGHADVYVRAACGAVCAHHAAWRVFAASAREPAALLARRCRSWPELRRAQCEGPPVPMGYSCPDTARGLYLYDPPNT